MLSLLQQILAVLVIASIGQAFELPLSRSRLRNLMGDRRRHQEIAKRQSPVGGFSYVSCVTDGGARALTGSNTWSTDMTPDKCTSICAEGGFTYAGLQNGNQCFVSRSDPTGGGGG